MDSHAHMMGILKMQPLQPRHRNTISLVFCPFQQGLRASHCFHDSACALVVMQRLQSNARLDFDFQIVPFGHIRYDGAIDCFESSIAACQRSEHFLYRLPAHDFPRGEAEGHYLLDIIGGVCTGHSIPFACWHSVNTHSVSIHGSIEEGSRWRKRMPGKHAGNRAFPLSPWRWYRKILPTKVRCRSVPFRLVT